jgi:hypothetical protein
MLNIKQCWGQRFVINVTMPPSDMRRFPTVVRPTHRPRRYPLAACVYTDVMPTGAVLFYLQSNALGVCVYSKTLLITEPELSL